MLIKQERNGYIGLAKIWLRDPLHCMGTKKIEEELYKIKYFCKSRHSTDLKYNYRLYFKTD